MLCGMAAKEPSRRIKHQNSNPHHSPCNVPMGCTYTIVLKTLKT